MTHITFLGQGAMGSRMTDRLQAAGFTVTRWNRTGATQTPRDAVADASIVIGMVRDDTASQAIWLDPVDGALAGMAPNALAIESSTLSVEFLDTLARAAAAVDRPFLDAPVLGSLPQAEAGQLIHLIGGSLADVDRARPILAAMGGKQLHVGPVGSGAALKLLANTMFGIQVAAMAEILARAHELGLDGGTTFDLLSETPLLSMAAKGAASLMLADRDEPMFPVDLVAKDFRYAIGNSAMPMAAAALGRFDAASAAGLGDRNLTAISRLGAGPVARSHAGM